MLFVVLSTSAMKVDDKKADAPEAAGAPNHVFMSFLPSPLVHCTFSSPSFESRLDEDWLDEGVRSCSLTATTVLVCIIMSIIVSLWKILCLVL